MKREIIRLGWQEDPNQLILYPGSNSDRTMAEVFGDQVVHIDPDSKALALLQKKGFRTKQMTIEDYIANMPDGEKIGMILSPGLRGETHEQMSDNFLFDPRHQRNSYQSNRPGQY